MNHLCTILLTIAVSTTSLAACTAEPTAARHATSSTSGVSTGNRTPQPQTEAQARTAAKSANFANWEGYKQSKVGIWVGMSHEQFEAKTTKRPDGYYELKVGTREYVISLAKFDTSGHLEVATIGYNGESKEDVRSAFNDFMSTAGREDFHPDLMKDRPNGNATDTDADSAEWFGRDSDVVAMRVYSEVLAKQVATELSIPTPAGGVMIVTSKR